MTKTKLKIHRRSNGQVDWARMYSEADLERRRNMSDEELWLDVLHELREVAELRTEIYKHELASRHPRVRVLIECWSQHWDDMDFCADFAKPGSVDQQVFKAEKALADEMIDGCPRPSSRKSLEERAMPKSPPQGYERQSRDPNLVRKLPPRTAGSDFYPYLHSQGAVNNLRPPAQQALGKNLLPDATRGSSSPLGGLATPAQPSGKGKR